MASEADTETEDYPCEGTMKHWRWWIRMNEKNMEGQLRLAVHRVLDLDGKLLKAGASLLEEMKERISPGWLKVSARVIYNVTRHFIVDGKSILYSTALTPLRHLLFADRALLSTKLCGQTEIFRFKLCVQ